MNLSGITAFALALLFSFLSEFVKGFGNNAGSQLSNTITRRSKPRRKKKSCLGRAVWIIVLTGIIWAVIKFYPIVSALI